MNAFIAEIIVAVAVLALVAAPIAIAPLRRRLIARPRAAVFRKVMPPMSQTEREAIEAGTVWWDGELFSGRPDWAQAARAAEAARSPPRSSTSSTTTSRSCARWSPTGRRRNVHKDLPPARLAVHQGHGFLGMIIPKEYGGLGFSAYAHSQVITKLSTHSRHRGGDGDGAELARARRAAAALRHRRAEAPLPAAARARASRSRASRSPIRTRARTRRRFPTTASSAGASTRASACSACASRGTSATSRSARSRRCSASRFARTTPTIWSATSEDIGITCALIPTSHPGRGHRPPAHAAQRGVPERPQLGQATCSSRWTG